MRRPKGPIAKKDIVYDGRVRGLWCTLSYRPYHHGVVAADWRRWALDHWEYWPDWGREPVPKPIVNTPAAGGLPALPRPPSEVLGPFSELHSFLTDVEWPGGGLIGEVQLTLRTRGCRTQAQLKLAAHGGLRLTADAASLDEALFTLEAALNANPVAWERDPYPLGGTGTKKK